MILLKKIIKYGILGIILGGYFFINPLKDFLTYEINGIQLTSFLAKNLYQTDEVSSPEPLLVKDYLLNDDRLYIFPIDDKITLPIDVLIVEVKKEVLTVIDGDSRYQISNFDSRQVNLYQYIYSRSTIGTTNDFFVIDGDNVKSIVERLSIAYEKV